MCSFARLTAVNVFQGFRHSPRHARRSAHARAAEEKPGLVQIPESEPDSSSGLRKRKVKKRVLPEFYQSVQVTPTRKLVGTNSTLTMINSSAAFVLAHLGRLNVSVKLLTAAVWDEVKIYQPLPCCKYAAKICRTQLLGFIWVQNILQIESCCQSLGC